MSFLLQILEIKKKAFKSPLKNCLSVFDHFVGLVLNGFKSFHLMVNPLSANPTKWSNTLKQFVGNLPKNCLRVFDHFVGLALKRLTHLSQAFNYLVEITNKRNNIFKNILKNSDQNNHLVIKIWTLY